MIIFENVSKNFGEKEVLKDVSVHLEKGKIHGICGRNGSGKSVFMKLAAGMLYPTAGEVTVHGSRLKKGEFASDTGILMDHIGFLRDQTGYTNLKILASILKKADDRRIREVMELVGLRADDRTVYGRYSSGMKQKLLFAQAIMEYPSLLLLDEPFNALDEESEQRFLSVLQQAGAGSCLLLLLTLPVLTGLYRAVLKGTSAAAGSILCPWIVSLLERDPYGILPALSAVIQLVPQTYPYLSFFRRLELPKAPKGMLAFSALMTFLICLPLPSAVGIYYLASGVFTAAEQALWNGVRVYRLRCA